MSWKGLGLTKLEVMRNSIRQYIQLLERKNNENNKLDIIKNIINSQEKIADIKKEHNLETLFSWEDTWRAPYEMIGTVELVSLKRELSDMMIEDKSASENKTSGKKGLIK